MSLPVVDALLAVDQQLGRLLSRLTRPGVLAICGEPPVAKLILGDPLELLAGVLPEPVTAADGPLTDLPADFPTARVSPAPDSPRRARATSGAGTIPEPGAAGATGKWLDAGPTINPPVPQESRTIRPAPGGAPRVSVDPAAFSQDAPIGTRDGAPAAGPTYLGGSLRVDRDPVSAAAVLRANIGLADLGRADLRRADLGRAEPGPADLGCADPGRADRPDQRAPRRSAPRSAGGPGVPPTGGHPQDVTNSLGGASPELDPRNPAAHDSQFDRPHPAEPGTASGPVPARPVGLVLGPQLPGFETTRADAPTDTPPGDSATDDTARNHNAPDEIAFVDVLDAVPDSTVMDLATAAGMDLLYDAITDRLRLDVLRAYGTTES